MCSPSIRIESTDIYIYIYINNNQNTYKHATVVWRFIHMRPDFYLFINFLRFIWPTIYVKPLNEIM